MTKITAIRIILLSILFCLIAVQADTLDYPHNSANNITCESCHFVSGGEEVLLILPEWVNHVPDTIDDTQFNTLCWSCHTEPLSGPLFMETHSSRVLDNGYGDWAVECRVCHNPHKQQFRSTNHGSEAYILQGTVAGVGTDTLTASGVNWGTNEYAGYVVVPNIAENKYNYQVLSNDNDTLTVKGTINQSRVTAADTFGISYGKLVYDTIHLDKIIDNTSGGAPVTRSGTKTVKFFNNEGANSFADGDLTLDGICEACHQQTNHFQHDGDAGDQLHSNMGSPAGTDCTDCHKHENGFMGMGGGAHATHVVDDNGPRLWCNDCHGANVPPLMADGVDLANTTVCENCHPADGLAAAKSYWNEELDTWVSTDGEEGFCGSCHDTTPGNTQQDGLGNDAPNVTGDKSTYGFFETGHGKPTVSGTFENLSWQEETPGSGNPAANRSCGDCHDLLSQHFGSTTSRLRAGFENDANNSNCRQCHYSGGIAYNGPEWYTTYTAFENSAHSSLKCTDCHDVHGNAGTYRAMTRGLIKVDSPANASNFCYDCHKDPGAGGIENLAVSGASYGNDIQEAFGKSVQHTLGTSFTINGGTYSLQCTSCHNVHIVTGKFWDADQAGNTITPVTRFFDNTEVWGDDPDEKMAGYAGSGLYQNSNKGDLAAINKFDGTEITDYPTFCLDCHQYAIGSIEAKNWNNDPHGRKVAGYTGLGLNYTRSYKCPNQTKCGAAIGWGSDECNGNSPEDEALCWPVIPNGAGQPVWVKGGYNNVDRNSGGNYVLSCTDCHEAHGSNKYNMLRKSLNTNNSGDEIILSSTQGSWTYPDQGGLCLSCHGGYWLTKEHMQWHMQDGYCSACNADHFPQHLDGGLIEDDKYWGMGAFICLGVCHSTSYNKGDQWTSWHRKATFHENRKSQSAATDYDTADSSPDLVVDYRFENNLKDSHMWNLHGLWINGSGSYVSGKIGNGIQVSNNPVEVGAEGSPWDSNNAGITGNTSKLTEMKYNMTLEAWVYPTSDPSDGEDRTVMTKHSYWSAGYNFRLREIGGEYRAGLTANMAFGGPTSEWDGDICNGLRGAYSSVAIPPNQWTHIAATFDASGPVGNPGDLSVGKIRIYVNGEDVTTSNSVGSGECWAQPQDPNNPSFYDEAFITSIGEINYIYPGRCSWCTNVLSVGGINWSDPNSNFIGKLDELKVWNITKSAAYLDESVPPAIIEVKGQSGYDRLFVTFTEGAYSTNGGTGALDENDFTLVDSDNGRSIDSVIHTPGANTAELILNTPLDAVNDLGVDTIAAASGAIYDSTGVTPSDTSAVTVTALPGPSITLVEGIIGNNTLWVTFSDSVYTSQGPSGQLVAADFVFTDDDLLDVQSVIHIAGDPTAILYLTGVLDAVDIGGATLEAAPSEIFDSGDERMGTETAAVTGLTPPMIESATGGVNWDKLDVVFSEGVYTNSNKTGVLVAGDFTLTDVSPNGSPRTVLSVSHIAGSSEAQLLLSKPMESSNDIDTDTLAADLNEIFNYQGNPVDTTPVTITAVSTVAISAVESVENTDTIKVIFVGPVYANDDQTGDLVDTDFVYFDTNGEHTSPYIASLTHTAGDTVAYLTMNENVILADFNADTLGAAGGSVFLEDGSVAGSNPVTLTQQAAPSILSVTGQTGYNRLEVTFDEGVWTGTGQSGVLVAADFSDSDATWDIDTVTHVAGESIATLNLTDNLASGDIGADTVAAVSGEIYNNMDNPVNTDPVTITLMPVPTIESIVGYEGGTDLYVTFTEGVSSDPVLPVSLSSLAANFVLDDSLGSNEGKSISSITHTGGDRFATFIMDGTFEASDGASCSDPDYDNRSDCEGGGGTWTEAAKLTPPAGSVWVWNRNSYPLGPDSIDIIAQDAPQIAEVNGAAGYDTIMVRFSQEVFANPGADPNDGLQVGDLTLVDGDGRYIDSVTHTPGVEHYQTLQDFAYVKLSSALDANDINVPTTTIAANGVYNFLGNPVPATAVQITTMPMTTITSVTGVVGSDKLQVTFKHYVSSSPGMKDALDTDDFILVDAGANNPRTITDVQHRPGDVSAVLTMSVPLTNNDLDNDTVAAGPVSIFNNYSYPVDDSAVTITTRFGAPKIKEVFGSNSQYTVAVYFDQGVYASADGTGSLQPSDFTYYEVRYLAGGTTNNILSVDHNPGDDFAILHFEYVRDDNDGSGSGTADFLADQIRPAAGEMFGRYGTPADLTPVTMIIGKAPFIAVAEGVEGSSKILVKFSKEVWTDLQASGSLVPGDFNYASNNLRTIGTVVHTPGNDYAVLNMSDVTIASDFDVDSFRPFNSQIYSGWDTKLGSATGVRKFLSRVPAPFITGVQGMYGSDQLIVTFSEGVRGFSGNLQSSDFVFTDVNGNNPRSIDTVTHSAGDSIAYLTMTVNTAASDDLGSDTIAATANLKSSLIENLLNTTPVVIKTSLPAIMSVEGSTTTTKVEVTFSGPVYSNDDRTGSLDNLDFALSNDNGNVVKTIDSVSHTAGSSTAILTLSGNLEHEDLDYINPDTLAPFIDSVYDAFGQAVDTTAVSVTSHDGPHITRVEGAAGLDKVQVNFSEGVYTTPGQSGALHASDFVLTDNDDSRTITTVEHYEGTASAVLTLSSPLDTDSDVGMDTVAAKSTEIFNDAGDPARTTPVTMSGNECPAGGFRLEFSEPAGSTTVTDNTGLVVGSVFDPGFSILGDGYFTGHDQQEVQTFIEFTQNTRCFKTPRAYTIEARVYYADVDLDYGDAYPLNGIDDDYDYGGSGYRIPGAEDPDGRNVTNTTLFYRGQGMLFLNSSRNNWNTPGGGDGIEERKDLANWHLRHSTKDQIICDGAYPGDTYVGSPGTQEEWGGEKNTYPITSGHYYTVRVVFNTDKGYLSFDLFTRDEGIDGLGTNAKWSGYLNVTRPPSVTGNCSWETNPGSEFREIDMPFFIGDDLIHDAYSGSDSPGHHYTSWIMGKVDWLSFKPVADYSGVDGSPWVGNTDPIADAGPDQNVDTGTLVTLDGSGSSDGDRDTLTYFWEITAEPGGSTASISGNGTDSPTFTPNVDGTYTIQLTVTDDYGGSSTDTVDVILSTP